MPMKLSVGVSRKLGLPGYSSVGATCSLEIELDSTILRGDPKRFQDEIRTAYAVCERAVVEELAHSQPVGEPTHEVYEPQPAHAGHNGHEPREQAPARPANLPRRPATPAQIRALWAIAYRRDIDLCRVVTDRFGLEDPQLLSLAQAS